MSPVIEERTKGMVLDEDSMHSQVEDVIRTLFGHSLKDFQLFDLVRGICHRKTQGWSVSFSHEQDNDASKSLTKRPVSAFLAPISHDA